MVDKPTLETLVAVYAEAKLAALRAVVDTARPFVEYADKMDGFTPCRPDSEEIGGEWIPGGKRIDAPTVGDCRKLRDALARLGEE